VQLLHGLAKTRAPFDDPNLVSHVGLVPVMALAECAGLGGLVAEHVRLGGSLRVWAARISQVQRPPWAGFRICGVVQPSAPLISRKLR
jgi:hypothetical protein